MRILFVALAVALPLPAAAECVILLHGLLRGEASMAIMAFALRNEGYETQNVGYPSTYDSVGSCQLTVNKANSNVCQLR